MMQRSRLLGAFAAPGALLRLAILLLAVLASSPALAHASLLSVDPADGTTLAAPPTSLSLTFNEQVAPVTLQLVAPDGALLPLAPDVEGQRLVAEAPAGLKRGTYALSWRVISLDGHPVGGTTTFSIGAPSAGGAAARPAAIDWPVEIGIWTTRVLTYVGLFSGVGGVFFIRWFGSSEAGLAVSRAALIAGLAALFSSIGLQGLDVLDRPIFDLLSIETWREGLASTFGLFVALALAGFALALLAASRVRLRRPLSLLAFVCVGLSLAMTGHASTADPQWLMRPAVFLHVSVVAFWVGALAPLAALLRGPADTALIPLRRFSGAMPPLLLLLVAAGTALAVVQIGSPAELLDTGYGRVFIAKMVLVAILLGLAAVNRWSLTPRTLGDAADARRRLGRSVGLELAIVVAIFGVVGLWRFTPPPRALLEAAAQPVDLHLMTNEAMAEMVVRPGRAGPVAIDVAIMGPDMGPFTAQGVTVAFANKSKGIEPIERQAKLQPDGSWHVASLPLPVGGTWQVEVEILVNDFKEVDLADEVNIRP